MASLPTHRAQETDPRVQPERHDELRYGCERCSVGFSASFDAVQVESTHGVYVLRIREGRLVGRDVVG